jgi:hypothetical protein
MSISSDDVYRLTDSFTGEWVNFLKTTTGYDGTTITSNNEATYIDNVIYIKVPSDGETTYAKRILTDGTINVKSFGVVGDGSTSDYLSFQNALRISSVYQIPISIHNRTTVNLDNKRLKPYANARIVFKGGTISNGIFEGNVTKIDAGIFKIFETTLTLDGSFSLDYICPQHFGAITNQSNDVYENSCDETMQACLDSPMEVMLPAGFYYISNPVYIDITKTIRLSGTTEIVSGTTVRGDHARIYTDQNIHMINVRTGGVQFLGGVIDTVGVTEFTKACIRFDLNNPIWEGTFDTILIGNQSELSSRNSLEGSGYYFDMSNQTANGYCHYLKLKGFIQGFGKGVSSDAFPVTAFSLSFNSMESSVNMDACKQFYCLQGYGGIGKFTGLLQCRNVLSASEKLEDIYPVEINSGLNTIDLFLWDIFLRGQSQIYTFKLGGSNFLGPFALFYYSGFANKELSQTPNGFDNPPLSVISKDNFGYSGTFISRLENEMASFDKRHTVTIKAFKGAGIDFDTDLDETVIAVTTDITVTNASQLFRNEGALPSITFTPSADLDEDFVEIVFTPSSGTFEWALMSIFLYQESGNHFKRIQFIDHYSVGGAEAQDIYPVSDSTYAKKLYKWYFSPQTSTKTIIRLIGMKVANSAISIMDIAGRRILQQIAPYIHIDGGQRIFGDLTTSQYKLSDLNTAPVSAAATGTKGEIRVTADYIYICIATNTWKRVAISTW